MKKLFLFAVVAVFSLASISAQDIRFGVKGGVNFANIAGDFGVAGISTDLEDAEMKVGFHIGGLAEFKLSEKFALQPELLFSNQGYKSNYLDNDDRKVDYNVNLNYINIPIMAKFMLIEGLAIEAGPQVGFLISAKNELNDSNNDLVSDDTKIDSKDLYKTLDFGLNFGVSYELPSGLFFSARYNLGLSKVDDEDYYGDVVDLGIFSFSRKNRVAQISAGFMF
ncbi:PorT family protein [Bizionia argentinensis JUB59]|uniref:PorT family protein n=1 Tax=Bizionia argentinensis JUB59 TaxID=1046627 RepID=G2ECC4_9FLAO|nr:porin family protein [Bizionia argentinensis]EGV43942.1 PorT family protein [Bizionia argentinensis JUB59]